MLAALTSPADVGRRSTAAAQGSTGAALPEAQRLPDDLLAASPRASRRAPPGGRDGEAAVPELLLRRGREPMARGTLVAGGREPDHGRRDARACRRLHHRGAPLTRDLRPGRAPARAQGWRSRVGRARALRRAPRAVCRAGTAGARLDPADVAWRGAAGCLARCGHQAPAVSLKAARTFSS